MRKRRCDRSAGVIASVVTAGVGNGSKSYCTSCYTGVYPVAFPSNEQAYLQLTLKRVDEEEVVS